MKKVEKTTRPFMYDLNQIPYDCIVEVRNRFKGLDLIDRVPDELWMEVNDIVQETRIKTIAKKKKCKKTKWLSEETLQIAVGGLFQLFWGRGRDFQALGHCSLLGLLTVSWNCHGISGCVISLTD